MSESASMALRFGALDWAILAAYGLGVVTLGAVMSRRTGSTRAYMLASRRIPFWAAGASLLATSLSAVTFIGGPEQAYAGNLTYLALNLGAILAAIIVAVLFIPAYYRQNVTTVYELLQRRFGPGARLSASGMFLIGRLFASGARLFAASIPMALILFGDIEPRSLMIAIGAIALVATVYTMSGGISAIIWTDLAQIVILLGAALLAVWMLLERIDLPLGEIIERLREAEAPDGSSKLTVIDARLDPSLPFTIWAALVGMTLFNTAAYGADQDLAQRLLTCKDAKRGGVAVVFSTVVGMVVVSVFLIVGLLLWLHDQQRGGGESGAAREAFLRFLLSETPAGVRGLIVAGIAAAAMSSLDSALGAMASSSVWDFYRRAAPGRSDAHYVRASRLAVVVWGALLGAFACVCVLWQASTGERLLEFALGVMVLAYGGLLGVFLGALLTRRGTSASATAALIAGFATALVLQHASWFGLPLEWSLGWRMTAATALSLGICIAPRNARSGTTG